MRKETGLGLIKWIVGITLAIGIAMVIILFK